MEYAQSKKITFTQTHGLTYNQIPTPALYNKTNNSIILNTCFTLDEQILAVAEIILSQQALLLPPEFRIKSQLIYTALSQAEQTTKLFQLGKELNTIHPLIQEKLSHDYPNIQTKTQEQTFISALKNERVRQKALTFMEQELYTNNQEETSEILTIAPTEIVKLFAENLPINDNIDYIAKVSSHISDKDFTQLKIIAAHWQDDSINSIPQINAYEDL